MTDTLLEQARELLDQASDMLTDNVEACYCETPGHKPGCKLDVWCSAMAEFELAYSSRAKRVMKIKLWELQGLWRWETYDTKYVMRIGAPVESEAEALSDARACAAALGMEMEIQE